MQPREAYTQADCSPLLVEWGRTARRFRPNFWIERTFAAIDRSTTDRIVITDVRYDNEVAAIVDRGGHVIRLNRPGFAPANEEEKASIALIDRFYPDLPSIQNDSTPGELGRRILDMILRKEAR